MFVRSSLALGSVLSVELAWDSLSLFLHPSPQLTYTFSLSPSLSCASSPSLSQIKKQKSNSRSSIFNLTVGLGVTEDWLTL